MDRQRRPGVCASPRGPGPAEGAGSQRELSLTPEMALSNSCLECRSCTPCGWSCSAEREAELGLRPPQTPGPELPHSDTLHSPSLTHTHTNISCLAGSPVLFGWCQVEESCMRVLLLGLQFLICEMGCCEGQMQVGHTWGPVDA